MGGDCRLREFLDPHFLAFIERVRRIEYDPVIPVKPLQDFERSAVIPANSQWTEVQFVISIHDDGAQAFRAEEQGIYRHLQARGGYLHLQVHLGEPAGE